MLAQQEQIQEEAAKLIPLLEEQLELYHRLKELADQQRELIVQEDPQPLLSLLAERQGIVDALANLNQQLVPVQVFWRNHYQVIDSMQRQTAEHLLTKVGDTLQGILKSDEEDSRLLAARKADTARRVATANTNQEASSAYGRSGKTTSSASRKRTDESA